MRVWLVSHVPEFARKYEAFLREEGLEVTLIPKLRPPAQMGSLVGVGAILLMSGTVSHSLQDNLKKYVDPRPVVMLPNSWSEARALLVKNGVLGAPPEEVAFKAAIIQSLTVTGWPASWSETISSITLENGARPSESLRASARRIVAQVTADIIGSTDKELVLSILEATLRIRAREGVIVTADNLRASLPSWATQPDYFAEVRVRVLGPKFRAGAILSQKAVAAWVDQNAKKVWPKWSDFVAANIPTYTVAEKPVWLLDDIKEALMGAPEKTPYEKAVDVLRHAREHGEAVSLRDVGLEFHLNEAQRRAAQVEAWGEWAGSLDLVKRGRELIGTPGLYEALIEDGVLPSVQIKKHLGGVARVTSIAAVKEWLAAQPPKAQETSEPPKAQETSEPPEPVEEAPEPVEEVSAPVAVLEAPVAVLGAPVGDSKVEALTDLVLEIGGNLELQQNRVLELLLAAPSPAPAEKVDLRPLADELLLGVQVAFEEVKTSVAALGDKTHSEVIALRTAADRATAILTDAGKALASELGGLKAKVGSLEAKVGSLELQQQRALSLLERQSQMLAMLLEQGASRETLPAPAQEAPPVKVEAASTLAGGALRRISLEFA